MVQNPFIKLLVCIAIWIACVSVGNAQIATNYSIGTWYQFKPAAVSYTFDDNCSNQLPVAMPLFDKYGFKVTFFTVTNWGPNWANLLTASKNGHEVASHTVTHADLSTLTAANQVPELANSQSTINTNITNTKCVTIAYPNCNTGDITTIQKYYIAGRICSGQIVATTPSDFYNISSNITGSTGSIQTAQNFDDKVAAALTAKGWMVFLTHGIDGDGGYSPTQSTELSTHLAYMNTNIANYWIATFGNVVKYIKERNAAALAETTISADSLKAVVTDNLDNTIYNIPITIRRLMPTGWAGAKVYLGATLITSTTVTVSGSTYIMFDAIPNQGTNYLVNTAATVVAAPTVTSPILYCQNATASVLTATGTALKWYTVATGGTALTSAPTPSTTTVGTITYYVSQTVGGVESARASITVTVNALPTISTGSAVAICFGTSTTLTATGGTSYKWSNSITTATNTVAPTTTTTYFVTGTNSSACSATSSVVVTVNTVPAAPTVITPINYTQGATATALTATGTSLNWYTSATGGTALTAAPVPTTTAAGTTNYYVSQTITACESPRATIAVVITAPSATISLHAGWNYVGCPISGSTPIASALSSIWSNVIMVKNFDVFYATANAPALNTLSNLVWGQGYLVKVSTACVLDWIAR